MRDEDNTYRVPRIAAELNDACCSWVSGLVGPRDGRNVIEAGTDSCRLAGTRVNRSVSYSESSTVTVQ